MAHVADLNGFVEGIAHPARRRRRRDDREPVRAGPDRPLRVRHDLPRALLLLLVHRGRRADAPPRPVPQRRRALPDAPRRHAALDRRRARGRREPSARVVPGRGAGAGPDELRATTSDFGARVERHPRPACATLLARPARPRAARSPPTAPPPRAARCSTTPASAPSWSTSSSTATCTSRGCYMPGVHLPICRARARCSRTSPTTCCSLAWNFKRRDHAPAGRVPRARRPLHRARAVPGDPVSAVDVTELAGTADLRRDRRVPELPLGRAGDLPRAARASRSTAAGSSTRARRRSTFPRGDLRLGFCAACGFITNTAFDPSLQDYGVAYEETQGFSPTFNAFAHELARRWVDALRPRAASSVLEIGCGKGEFLDRRWASRAPAAASASTRRSSPSALDTPGRRPDRVHRGPLRRGVRRT